MSLGSYLRSLRETLSLTLRAVEKETGISNAFLSQLESGKVKQPSPIILYKLAKVYQVSYEELMEGAGYPVPSNHSGTMQSPPIIFNRLGNITKEEEQELLDYLAYIRSRARRRNKINK